VKGTILIKPHHFIDIVRALGTGQVDWKPHPYGHNLHGVAERVVADRDAILQIELGADDVCQPCLHNVHGQCDDVIDTSFRPQAPRSKQQWNLLIDRRWCQVLRLKQGDHIAARQFCERVRNHFTQLPDIYLELPAAHLAKRARELERGLEMYLGDR
jgi:hypothetical protein